MGESPDPYDIEPHDEDSGPEKTDTPPARIDRPSVLADRDEACPRCGAALPADAVLCVDCGYDLRVNVIREAERGEDNPPDDPEEPDAFVEASPPSVKALGIIGGLIVAGAVVSAGVFAQSGGVGNLLRASFLSLYNVGLHTGTGFVAVVVVAWLCEEKVGRLSLAAARMFVAFGVFELTRVLLSAAPGGRYYWILGALGLYWLVVWALFRKKPAITLLLMLAHMVLWAVVMLGIELSATGGG